MPNILDKCGLHEFPHDLILQFLILLNMIQFINRN